MWKKKLEELAQLYRQQLIATKKRASERDAALRAARWLPDEGQPLDFEALRGIKIRWATGPEQYQQDADALIGAVNHLTRERDDALKRVAAVESVVEAARKVSTTRDPDAYLSNSSAYWRAMQARADLYNALEFLDKTNKEGGKGGG